MLCVSLFGKLNIQSSENEFQDLSSLKSKELFAYLLLNRDRLHAREKVASALWGDHCTTAKSRKLLRNALWQLQSALNCHAELQKEELLLVQPDWIQLNSIPILQLDVHAFETVYASVEGVPGAALKTHVADRIDGALQLYRGDLLEAWYHDWCLYERERMLQIYLILLDKMMSHCEASSQFEKGLSYGQRILRHDRARECTHRQMMRLHYLVGDRSTALRQYNRCAAALREELDVAPSQYTTSLYEQIRADRWETLPSHPVETGMEDVFRSLQTLQASLARVRHRVQRTEQSVGAIIRNP